METIQELRKILQEEKVRPMGWSRPFGYKTLQRGPSIYITKLLLYFPVKPDYVTILGILVGLLGCWFIFLNPWNYKLAGIILLYLNTIFDRVDGEIARYKKIFSLKGIYLDEVNHLAIPALFFLCFAFGLPPFSTLIDYVIFISGSVAALSMVLIRISHSLPQQIFIKKYIKNPEIFKLNEKSHVLQNEKSLSKKKYGILKLLIQPIHFLQEFFIILLVFGLIFIFERLLMANYIFFPISSWLLLAYGLMLPIIFIENVFKGFCLIERKIASLKEGFF